MKIEEVKQMKSHFRIQDSLVLLGLFVLFGILTVAGGVATKGYKNKYMGLLYNSMNIFAGNQKTQFEQFIANKVTVLQGLVQYPDIYEMNVQEQEAFLRKKAEKFGFRQLFVLDKEGNGYYFEDDRYINQSEQPFFYNVMKQDVYISEPFYGADRIITTVSVSIYNDGEKQGVLCGSVELHSISDLFVESEVLMNGIVLLLNREGRYLVAESVEKLSSQNSIFDETDSEVMLISHVFEQKQDKIGTVILDGIAYTAHAAYLPGYDWVMVQCVESEELFEELNYFNLWRFGSILIIVLICFCVLRIINYWYLSMKRINTDPLTKCSSRVAMESMIEKLEEEYEKQIALIYFDLNKFKLVNDVYGHEEGDHILCLFGEVLMTVFHKYAKVGRMGGDEFLAISVEIDEEKLSALCRKVNDCLQERSRELKLPYEVSTSFGYAIRPRKTQTPLSEIMRRADEAMYEYKKIVHEKIR